EEDDMPIIKYNQTAECSPPTPYAGPTQEVTGEFTGLKPEVKYNYRLVAKNAQGLSFGKNQVIIPHYVDGLVADPPEEITRTTVDLKAHVNGNGEEDNYYFEWGTVESGGFANKSAAPPGPSIGSPTGNTPLSFEATSLIPETEYQFRVVVKNG